jgi:hypothetical protein
VIDIKMVLDVLGIDGPSLVAGFVGGLISDFFDKQSSGRERIGIILSGSFFPAYGAVPMTQMVVHLSGITQLPHVFVALLMGYGGIQGMRMTYARFFMSKESSGGKIT